MHRNTLSRAFPVAALLVCAGVASAQQSASDPPRPPANANAIMRVEVAKLLASPMAKEAGWQAKVMKGYADRPIPVPPTAKRVTVVAGVHPVGMQAIWQAAVIELSHPMRMDPMLRAQGGYLDKIGGKQAAWTPRDVFYVEFEPNTLGVLRPGQRQFVTRWVTPAENQPELSAFLKQAWAGSSGADVMFAMDTHDMVGALMIRYADSMGEFPSLDKLAAAEDEKLFAALASVKGVRLTAKVDKTIAAEIVADFDQDVSALGASATPFVHDVLRNAAVAELGLEQWQFAAKGKQIVGKGEMTGENLSQLIAMLAPASAEDVTGAEATTAAAKQSGETGTPADPQQAAAMASQKYYKAVASMLDSISKTSSPSQLGSSFISKARRIDQLPILHVDPALVSWGNMVAEGFNRAAQELAIGQGKASAAAQGVSSPTAYTTYSAQGGGNSTPESRAAYRNAAQQRRQVSQTERAAAADRAFTIMQQVLPSRGKIRAEMTQKYGVEF